MQIAAGAITTTASGASSAALVAWSSAFQFGGETPVFVEGPDLRVFAEDGEQEIVAWATQIVTAPADAPPATARFVVSISDGQLFAVSPSIDSSGNLYFTPAPNSQGTAIVTVVLTTGAEGEEAGDVDTTTFTIEVIQQYPLQNDLEPLYVNDDFSISADDVLQIINFLNAFGASPVLPGTPPADPYYDPTGDNYVAPNDALEIINYLNAYGATPEGESNRNGTSLAAAENQTLSSRSEASLDDLISLLTFDVASQPKRRR
jgi:hypothetical protein